MRLMMKSALERVLNTEMDVHLGRKTLAADADQRLDETPADAEPAATPASPGEAPTRRAGPPNRRNGRSRKTVQGSLGELTLAAPLCRVR